MQSIPANKLVAVQPGVLGTGGNPLSLNSVFGTESPSVPYGVVMATSGLLGVQNFFGEDSPEAALAEIYFSGWTKATRLPGTLYFAQYNATAIAGYLRSGQVPSLTALQAFSGTLIMAVNGRTLTTPSINLASATSFSNAAALIQAGLQSAGATFTGTATLDGTTAMHVTVITNGTLAVGDVVAGTGITVGTTVTAIPMGGGVGIYTLSAVATTESAETVTVAGPSVTVTYSSQLNAFTVQSPTTGVNSSVGFATGTLAADVLFTQATGAVLSAGAAATTPAAFVALVQSKTLNWAGLTTVFDPDAGAQGGPVKVAFAQAISAVSPAGSERFFYVGEDTDITVTEGPAPTSFAGLTESLNGRIAVYGGGQAIYGQVAAFFCGMAASINWAATGGRITFAEKSNANLTPNVTDEEISDTLDANGYNYYGGFATQTEAFQLSYNGQISGDWDWIDEYVDQIYINSQFQLALLSYVASVNRIPYNNAGYTSIRGAMKAPITEALNNGSIETGVTLSGAQIQALMQATGGIDISSTLYAQGWYLQILDPGAQARGNRTTPNMTFWYTDGGAIQQLTLASIDIQ